MKFIRKGIEYDITEINNGKYYPKPTLIIAKKDGAELTKIIYDDIRIYSFFLADENMGYNLPKSLSFIGIIYPDTLDSESEIIICYNTKCDNAVIPMKKTILLTKDPKCKIKQENIITNIKKDNDNLGYIYIIRDSECFRYSKNIYRIEKTDDIDESLGKYTPGYDLLFEVQIPNYIEVHTKIIELMNNKFKKICEVTEIIHHKQTEDFKNLSKIGIDNMYCENNNEILDSPDNNIILKTVVPIILNK